MSTLAPTASSVLPPLDVASLFRLSVADYHEMGERGILTPDDRVELLDGYLVVKPVQKSPHASTVVRTGRYFDRMLPDGYVVRTQVPITLDASEPEPDAAVVRGNLRTYDSRNPLASEAALVVEVADSTLRSDRWKGSLYAGNSIPEYWIVNIHERQVEVYTQPSGPGKAPTYGHRKDFSEKEQVPLLLDGRELSSIPVADLLP
jgi:Uma2 family endonuclease